MAGRLIDADYAQIEPRCYAAWMNDKEFIKVFKSGSDPYTPLAYKMFVDVGSVIVSKKKAKKDLDALGKKSIYRFYAKQTFLGVIYQKGPESLGEELGTDKHAGQAVIDTIYQAVPKLGPYCEQSVEMAQKHGYVTTFGPFFPRLMPHIFSDVSWIRARQERQAINTRIQGSASVVTLMAAHYANVELMKNKMKCVLWNLVHDATKWDCWLPHLKKAKAIIVHTMETVADRHPSLKWLKRVPLLVDVKTGKNWGDLK